MEHKGTATIFTKRLILRPIKPDDAEDVFEWMSDPEVCRYERWTSHESVAYCRGYIREVFDYSSESAYQWGMEYDGRLIGYIVIVNIDDHDQKGVMGYAVARKYWSNGFATEAAMAVLRYMFVEVGLNRIEACHSVQNPASGRVLEKAGFTREGFAKEYFRSMIGFQDSYLYGVTRGEYAHK